MTEGGASIGVFRGLLSLGSKAFNFAFAGLITKNKLAGTELEEVREEIKALREAIIQSSVEAQNAVRGSSNDPGAQEAQRVSLRLATEAGQRFAVLFPQRKMSETPVVLLEARRRYREVVGDEQNLDVNDPAEQAYRCQEIESVTEEFVHQIDNGVFKILGVGLGRKAGALKGRKLPS